MRVTLSRTRPGLVFRVGLIRALIDGGLSLADATATCHRILQGERVTVAMTVEDVQSFSVSNVQIERIP